MCCGIIFLQSIQITTSVIFLLRFIDEETQIRGYLPQGHIVVGPAIDHKYQDSKAWIQNHYTVICYADNSRSSKIFLTEFTFSKKYTFIYQSLMHHGQSVQHMYFLQKDAFKGCPQYLFMKYGFYESDTPCKIRQYDLKNKGFKSVDYYTT